MRISLLASACVIAASCSDSQTAPVVEFEVVTTVSPSLAKVGDRVSVTVTATNVSGHSQQLLANDCVTAFSVFDSSGTHVAPSAERSCTASAKVVTLSPGEQYSVTQPWAGNALPTSPDAPASIVGPGTYEVRGTLALGERIRTVRAAFVRLTGSR